MIDMKNLKILLTALLLGGVVACSNLSATVTLEPTWIATLTPVVATGDLVSVTPFPSDAPTLAAVGVSSTPAPTITPTLPSPLPLSSYALLPPGQYIVYQDITDQGDAASNLYAISIDGKHQQILTNRLLRFDYLTMHADGKRLIVYKGNMPGITLPSSDFIWDLKSDTLSGIKPLQKNCEAEYSPDLTKAALSNCRDDENGFRHIYVEGLDVHTLLLITKLSRPSEVYNRPVWSPNGQWLAYFNLPGTDLFPGEHDIEDGLYLMEVSCLTEPDTCPSRTQGPYHPEKWIFMPGPLTWSPDSRYLAMLSDTRQPPVQIEIFDTITGKFSSLGVSHIDIGPNTLRWSPDGEWLAYTATSSSTGTPPGLYIIPVAGGSSLQLVESGGIDLQFWLSMPQFEFQVGLAYTITEEGANLNLRDTPSLNSSVLAKLHPGDIVVFLDGPIYADGYVWWQMRLESEEIVGWAVEQPEWYTPTSAYLTPTP